MEYVVGLIKHATGTWYFACSSRGLVKVARNPIEGVAELDDHPLVKQHAVALRNMLDGVTNQYTLPMVLEGTEFQRRVWQAIAAIDYGKTKSYSQIAHELGGNAVRAVGTACGANPLPIAIPCHRVLRSNGELGGFGLGLELKAKLLELEQPQRHAKKAA